MKLIQHQIFLRWCAFFGFILFIVSLLLPGWLTSTEQLENNDQIVMITKADVADTALTFADELLLPQNVYNDVDVSVFLSANEQLYGYLTREELLKAYDTDLQRQALEYYVAEIQTKNNESLFVYVDPYNNKVLSWFFDSSIPIVERANDRQIAYDYVASQNIGLPAQFTDYKLTQKNQNGWVFTTPLPFAEELTRTYTVYISDGTVYGFKVDDNVPASFQAMLDRQQNMAAIITLITYAVTLFMSVCGLVMTILKRREITFSRGAILTLLFLVFYVWNNFNMYSGLKAIAPHTKMNELEAMSNLIFINVMVVALSISLYFAFVSSKTLWQGTKHAGWYSVRRIDFSKQLNTAMRNGYIFGLIFLGIQSVILMIAEYGLGVWSSIDVASSPYNTYTPLIIPLLAWCAAIQEEGFYRLFGIGLFKKIFKNTTVAVVLTSIIWAAGHVGYPIYPIYTRLVEVGLLGILFSILFLKYGFLTALFTHATINLIWFSLSVIAVSEGQPIYFLAAFIYIASPYIISRIVPYIARLKRKKHSF